MMRKIWAGLVLALCWGTAPAQEAAEAVPVPPDYDRVFLETADPASPYYYPTLFSRYERGDTTLTPEDFRYLYYGYPEQPGYRPLLRSAAADSLDRIFSRRTTPTADDYRRMTYLARRILSEEPFSLRDLNVLAFAYQMLDEPELARQQFFKLQGVFGAICSTGTGLEEKSPFYIIYMKDAEDVLTLLDVRAGKLKIITRTVGFVSVPNMKGTRSKGYYFDFGEVYKRKPDYLDEVKGRRKMEINPLYNPNSKLNTFSR